MPDERPRSFLDWNRIAKRTVRRALDSKWVETKTSRKQSLLSALLSENVWEAQAGFCRVVADSKVSLPSHLLSDSKAKEFAF